MTATGWLCPSAPVESGERGGWKESSGVSGHHGGMKEAPLLEVILGLVLERGLQERGPKDCSLQGHHFV